MNITSPNQPKDSFVLKLIKQANGRSFNVRWYKDFPWMHYCSCRKTVFCSFCLQAHQKGFLTSLLKTAFIIEGFQNWKRAVECFKVHEKAKCHKEAKTKFFLANTPTIVEQLSVQGAKTQAENRCMLLKLISTLKFLLRQELAIRGHSDTEGNYSSCCP